MQSYLIVALHFFVVGLKIKRPNTIRLYSAFLSLKHSIHLLFQLPLELHRSPHQVKKL